MMDSSANDESMETRINPSEPEIDLADEEGFPKADPLTMPVNAMPPMADPPMSPVLADPGIYVCIAENAGEHALLGRLDFGEEYDYSHEHNPETLAAVAACCESGLLEKA